MESNMDYFVKISIFCCILFHSSSCEVPDEMDINIGGVRATPDEQRLMDELFIENKYDASVRPVYNSSDNVEVTFGFTLIKLMDMEEKNQVLVTNAWLEMYWFDERMFWDPAEYNDMKLLRLPAEMLWLPDIVLYNNADDYTTGFMPGKLTLDYNGSVFWGPPVRFRSSCTLNVGYFPFDKQKCTLKFGSWTYPKHQLDILNLRPEVDVMRYVSNGEWQLLEYTTTRYEMVYPGVQDEVFPDVKVHLVIQRRILYYVINILLSCVWLSILTLLDFCLPPDEGEKITLGITVLLSYAFFMLLVANSMPPSSDSVSIIGMYLFFSMAVNSVSVILAVLVLKLHHSSPHQTEVPHWVRVLILQGLAWLVRCQCPPVKKIKRRFSIKPKHDDPQSEAHAVCVELMAADISWSPIRHSAYVKNEIDDLENESTEITASTPMNASRQGSYIETNINPFSVRMMVVNQISKYLKYLVSGAKEDIKTDRIMNEWKQVALVVDRFLFWVFLSVTVIGTCVILIILPSVKMASVNAL